MTWTSEVAEKIRKGEPVSFPLQLALSAATPAVRFGMWTRKMRRPVRVDAHVVSIGNITAGGTGKTPAVIRELDRLSADANNTVAVLTRGFGARSGRTPLASSDVPPARRCELLGDEPALILQKHPDVLIVKNPDRVTAARTAIDTYGCNVLVLDDGFQYVRLHRDVNQLVIDATNPFGNGHLLPRGILREPVSAVTRATEIVLTRCDQAKDVDSIESTIRQWTGVPILRTKHRPVAFVQLSSGQSLPLTAFETQKVSVASAIGNPDAFIRTIEQLGIEVARVSVHRDHARIPTADLAQDRPVIVTEKDAVKIEAPPDNVYALSIALEPLD